MKPKKATLDDVREQLDDKVLDQLVDEKPEHAEVIEEIKTLKALLDETNIETEEESKLARTALHKLHRKMSDLPILNESDIDNLSQIANVQQDDDEEEELDFQIVL